MRPSRFLLLVTAVLLGASSARAAVVMGNFAIPASTTGTAYSSLTTYKTAGFTMGAQSYTVTKISLSFDLTWGTGNGVPLVTMWDGDLVGPITKIATLPNPPGLTGIGDFDFFPSSPLVLAANKSYWLHVTTATTAGQFRWTTTTPETDPSGIATFITYIWNGGSSSLKNRFQIEGTTAPSCASPFVDYGTGCPGSGGFVPYLSLDTCAVAGSPVSLSISKGLGGSTAFLFFGLTQAAVPIGFTGCFLNVAPLFPQIVGLPLGGSGAGTGSVTINGVVPAGTTGVTVTIQTFVVDTATPHGYCNSNGIKLAIS